MFAVVVTLKIKPDHLERFMPLMQQNAATSLRDEPGCHQFDIATDNARPGDIFLYELYSDAAAFDAHLASDHFKAFDAATADSLLDKSVRTYAQVIQ
ncbi:antibiotic biosynthesis monooxygenase [Roseobacter cerasinus]|uniref:Antibiotic biosynthesis monooxygenase n=1 Tax=Roseobacter cerasinus TaxID=2602289 RepID=A0A640VVF8_9RHOB|nr:putative quinol monooxygenase [Roseobacter cerasinus]GFE51584.1 antibiotic biosynthesis monooxygenase [Roseobacter cerasinus]